MSDTYLVAKNYVKETLDRCSEKYGEEYKYCAAVGTLEAHLNSILFMVYCSSPETYKKALEYLDYHTKTPK
jgi:transcriptional regulatory protein LevR